jgi:hypothetical protein
MNHFAESCNDRSLYVGNGIATKQAAMDGIAGKAVPSGAGERSACSFSANAKG